jgi:hypothetical protein
VPPCGRRLQQEKDHLAQSVLAEDDPMGGNGMVQKAGHLLVRRRLSFFG